jgi:uncharacterized protein YcbK (DUF882 family)
MSFSTRTMLPADWAALQHFSADEFNVPEAMGVEFMQWLDEVRDRAGVAMTPTSDYRSPARNAAVGGSQNSAHSDWPCNSIDIGRRPHKGDPNWNYSRFKIIEAALALGCTRIGLYPGGSLHLDRTETTRPSPRIWIAVDNPARG